MANYHVTHNRDTNKWNAKKAGGKKASRTFDTQRQATKQANDFARSSGGGEVSIHRKDNNRIRDKNTIGKRDPFPPRG